MIPKEKRTTKKKWKILTVRFCTRCREFTPFKLDPNINHSRCTKCNAKSNKAKMKAPRL